MADAKIVRYYNQKVTPEEVINADQVEWAAYKQGSAILEYGIHDDLIVQTIEPVYAGLVEDSEDDSLGGIIPGESHDWQEQSNREERLVGQIGEEVERRKLTLGEWYPFELTGNKLVYEPSRDAKSVYSFCLAIAQYRRVAPSASIAQFNSFSRTFELLATEILSHWLGRGSIGWHIGWPERASFPGQSAENIWTKIGELADEWKWGPSDEYSKLVKSHKDFGVDFLIWRSLGDWRPGAIYLVGQCACGQNIYDGKNQDIDFLYLSNFFRSMPTVGMIKTLVTPFCFASDGASLRAQSGSLLFDRLRLVLASACVEFAVLEVVANRMRSLLREITQHK